MSTPAGPDYPAPEPEPQPAPRPAPRPDPNKRKTKGAHCGVFVQISALCQPGLLVRVPVDHIDVTIVAGVVALDRWYAPCPACGQIQEAQLTDTLREVLLGRFGTHVSVLVISPSTEILEHPADAPPLTEDDLIDLGRQLTAL